MTAPPAPPSALAREEPRRYEPPRPNDRGLEPLRAAHFEGRAATQRIPEARDVLEALQIAGIYEPAPPHAAEAVRWERPLPGKRRLGATLALVGAALLLMGGGAGTWRYVVARRAKDHVVAEDVLAKVDADLRAGDPSVLPALETAIGRAFELESRSPHAALGWLRERALKGLLVSGEDLAFEEAIARAKEVGVPEGQIAFAHVASFLYQGDTAGAAATVAKWDAIAHEDAWFHLLAGATFERAGDPRALERYNLAAKLDPELVVAQLRLARATAVDGDPRRAAELASDLSSRHPSRLEPKAVVTLAWARDPLRAAPPREVAEVIATGDALPTSLRAVAYAARAIAAIDRHSLDEAKPALQKALGLADTPGMAAWIGSIGLATGDEELARRAALRAVSFSAAYPAARVLAARVALLGARLDEAQKAVEDLAPSSPDVAVVSAAVAYEKVDGEGMSRALDALDEPTKKLPFVAPLVRGRELLAGNRKDFGSPAKVLDMADDDAPWADLVALDFALEGGDLDLAAKIAGEWGDATSASRALRLARLARYQGNLDDADRFSRAAETGTVTLRVLAERVFQLVSAGKTGDALTLFRTYPNVGGPLAKWLRAYALASAGKVEEARAAIAQEDPPPPLAPPLARTIAALAYGAIKDTRHGKPYVKAVLETGASNPDLTAAAEKLGLVGGASRRH